MFPCGLTPASVRLSVWSGRRRGSSQRAARLYARGPRSRLPDGLGLDQTPGNALRRGQKRTGRTPTPDFRLPSLCFVIYRSVAAGSPAPADRGGASLSGRMRERPPLPFLLPGRGAHVFLLRPLGGEGRLAATSLAPRAPLRLVASPRGHLQAGSPVPPPVSRVPRGLPAPVLWRCLCPRVRDAALRSRFPSGSGVCMGKSLCQLCRWAKRPGERTDGQRAAPPDSRSASPLQALLSDHG